MTDKHWFALSLVAAGASCWLLFRDDWTAAVLAHMAANIVLLNAARIWRGDYH